jgi:hypothetical protein
VNASLNEIESLCKKAARGAGLSWGLAEEAGKTARWLSGNGLDGPALLAAQLRLDDGCEYAQLAPDTGAEKWELTGRAMCPLMAGVTLSDHAYLLRENGSIQLGEMTHPQLLMPFSSAAARQLGIALQLSWQGCVLEFSPSGEVLLIQADSFASPHVVGVNCTCIAPASRNGKALGGSIHALAASVHDYLDSLAARTYVPASEASRLSGAGAGLSDNI